MGGTSKTSQTQSSTSQTLPYGVATPGLTGSIEGLNGLLSSAGLNANQSDALNQIIANANNGQSNNYAGLLNNSATSLLNGGGAQANDQSIRNNLSSYQGLLTPYANGSMIGQNSGLKPYLDTLSSDITNQVNGQFAAAGRDFSGANQGALGRGLTQGLAPVIASQYNTDVGNQLNAANALYGAGNTTYGLLNGTQAAANQNQLAGAGQASTALQATNYAPNSILNAEQQRFNIPASNYTTLLGALSPVAQAFGTNNASAQSQGTQQMSGAQQFALIANGLGTLLGAVNPLKSGTPSFGGLPS